MRYSVSTASLLHFSLSRAFSLIKSAGFNGVELAISWEVILRGTNYVKWLADRYELPVLSVHQPMFRLPGWQTPEARLVRTVQVGVALGSEVVTVHPPAALRLGDETSQRFMRALDACRRELRPGTVLTIENPVPMYRGRVGRFFAYDDPRDLRRFVEEQELPVTLDTSHASLSEIGLLSTFDLLKERIANVHLSDLSRRRTPRLPIGMLHTLFAQHQVPGTGELPLRDLLFGLHQINYAGLITVEVSPFALSAWNKRRAIDGLSRSLSFCLVHATVAGFPAG